MSDTAPDGAVIVTPTVRDILHALANAWESEGEQMADNVREHRGDYLADLEAFTEDVAAQLRLLASGSWGAGTSPE